MRKLDTNSERIFDKFKYTHSQSIKTYMEIEMLQDTPSIASTTCVYMMPGYSETTSYVRLDGDGATSPNPYGVGKVTVGGETDAATVNLVTITGVSGYEDDTLVAIQSSDPAQSLIFLRGAKDATIDCQCYHGEPYPFPWSASRWELFRKVDEPGYGTVLHSLVFEGYVLAFKGGKATQLSLLQFPGDDPELRPGVFTFTFEDA